MARELSGTTCRPLGIALVLSLSAGAAGQTADTAAAEAPATAPASMPTASTTPATAPASRLTLNPVELLGPAKNADFTSLSIEDLLNIEVVSISRQKQRVADSPAPVTVITADDIHRLQYQNFPELLRTAPGIYVGQIDATHWAVGSRGGAAPFTLNMLAMMDGRSLYSINSAGVFWRTVDYVLPDIERIEVVRGPGATLWGANAVNGVINIITKDTKDTQGLLLDSYAGTDGVINSLRYGGKVGDLGFFRVYAKARDLGAYDQSNGTSHDDQQDQYRTGFRTDLHLSPDDLVTAEGDFFRERFAAIVAQPTATLPFSRSVPQENNASGGNLLVRWTHTVSETSDFSLQGYFDNLTDVLRDVSGTGQAYNTFDLDFQHRFALGDAQEIVWGADYRLESAFNASLPHAVEWAPEHTVSQIASAFVQDDVTLVPERLHLIAGTKVEHDSVANAVELEPSIRAIWTPDQKNTFWVGVSRAARTPSVFELASTLTVSRFPGQGGVPFDVDLGHNPHLPSEHLMAYEAGYRVQPMHDLSLDLNGFYYAYDHAYEYVPQAPVFQGGQLVETEALRADQNGQNWGFEVAANWNPTDKLSLNGSYSYLNMAQFGGAQVHFLPSDPQNQFKLGINYELLKNVNVDTQFYWTDKVPSLSVNSFFRWDAGIRWQMCKNAELSAGVWNITDNSHPEQNGVGGSGGGAEVPRTFFTQLQVRF